ncbi:MAG: protein kinase [Granulosicoccus sp.]
MEVAELQTMLLTGDEIGCYRIESFLGKGGFGVTYLALDTMLNMQVAIKEYMPEQIAARSSEGSVRPKTTGDAEIFSWGLSRFIKEAQTLARFNHPNIVRVMAVFEQNGTAYMVMEYERGKDLKLQLRHEEYRTQENLTHIVGPIIDGLDEVHRLGYIHRDIKPANILIRNNGTPVLLDFGSARLAIGSQTQNLTALVSVGYAPLEQYNSSNDNQQGPWTDIYALGAVLYYAITGNAPVDSTLRGSAVLNDKPDPLQPLEQLAPAGFNKSFCQAIDWALNFKVADRPSNLGEWRASLLADDPTVLMPSMASRKIYTQADESITPEIVNTSQPRYFTKKPPSNSPESVQTRTAERRAPQRDAANGHKRPATAETDVEDWDTSSIGSKVYANQRSEVQSKKNSNRALIYSCCLLLAIGAGAVALFLNGLLPVPFLEPGQDTVRTEQNNQADVQEQQLAEQEAQARQEENRILEQQRQLEQERQLKLEREQAAAEEQRSAELERQRVAAELERQKQQALEQEQERQAEALRKAEEAQRQASIEKRRLEQEAEQAALEEQARLEKIEQKRQEALEAQRVAERKRAEERRVAELNRQQAAERALEEQAAQEAALEPKIDSSKPITDRDIAAVWDQFKSLTTAIEERDGQALRRLTDDSARKYNYFDYVFKTFEQIDVSISNIQASRFDQTVRGTLNISRMKRGNGDMAFPPAEFQSIPISAVRYGEWSRIKW